MKTASFLLLALFGTLLFTTGQFSIALTDIQAAFVWNLELVLAPILWFADGFKETSKY